MGTPRKLFSLWTWFFKSYYATQRPYLFSTCSSVFLLWLLIHTVHGVYECLFSSSRAARPVLSGTITGFCLERTWEEGDRRVNEWRGFWGTLAEGHDECVGKWAIWLNNAQRNSHPVTSQDDTRAHSQQKCRWNWSIHSPFLLRQRVSINDIFN